MTMLAYYIKPVLELVPEAMPMVKQASITEEMPLDGRDSTMASALAMEYMIKIAHVPVALEDMEKVSKAVSLYGMEDSVNEFKHSMIKRSAARNIKKEEDSIESYMLKQAYFEGELTGTSNIDNIVKEASYLYTQAKDKNVTPSDEVIRYSGNGYLNKEAAMRSLSLRYSLTKEDTFIKLAKAVSEADDILSKDILDSLCSKITYLDKSAGLSLKGFNFYKEAVMTKESELKSSMYVSLAGSKVPYEKIERVGKSNISSYIGKDVAKEMDSGPATFKQVVETLPLDLQQVLLNLTKNV